MAYVEDCIGYINDETVCIVKPELIDFEEKINPVEIKSENVLNVDEIEEPKDVANFRTQWNEDAFHDLKAENINSCDGTHIKCERNHFEYTVKCEVGDTKIMLGTEEFMDSSDPLAHDIQSLIKDEKPFVPIPDVLCITNIRSGRKFPNQLDDTATFTLKQELTKDKNNSVKLPARERIEDTNAIYFLECDTSTKAPLHKCPDCADRFKLKRNLERHQMFKHSKAKPHKCTECNKCFTTKPILRIHHMSLHLKLKPHKCPDCEKTFVTKFQLNQHQMSRHSTMPKPHKCPDCERSFAGRAHRDRHQKSQHLKLKPHKCPDCEKSFTRRAHLDRHEMSRHLKLKPLKCTECEQSFGTKSNLDQHQMSKHLKLKPHKCSQCEKSFATKQILNRHQMFRHLKLKPHKCPDCEKSFATKHILNRHQISRHFKH